MIRQRNIASPLTMEHLDSFLGRDICTSKETARETESVASTAVSSTGEITLLSEQYHSKVRDSFNQTVSTELRGKLEELDVQLSKLQFSTRDLVGREEEVEQLFSTLKAYRQQQEESTTSCNPKSRLISITGLSGTGKTVLARQLKQPVLKAGGYFCLGKFDSNAHWAQPYTAFAAASNDLADQILELDTLRQEVIRKKIQAAVGDQGIHLLLEVFPGLSRIVQPSDTVEVVHASIDQKTNQLQFMARQLIRVLSHHQKSPLVLVLDDVQWADQQSLNLVQELLTDRESSLLLVVTSRSNEISEDHPFSIKMEAFRQAELPVDIIPIGNLTERAVQSVVANALRESEDYTNGLAGIVYEKTLGNAFFVVQYLHMLVNNDLLTYNIGAMKWVWEDGAIDALSVADNVGSLLADTIQKLPEAAQTLLKIASCLGPVFDESTLLGALVSLGEAELFDLEFVDNVINAISLCIDTGLLELVGSKYSFVHDQIQSSSFRLIPEEALPRLQLEMGRGLLRRNQGSCSDDVLFLAVDLCNCGLSLVHDDQLRLGLAFQNLKAAEKAVHKSCAFDAAIDYAKTAMSCLEPIVVEDDVSKYLVLRLNVVLAQASFCVGDCEATTAYAGEVVASDFPFTDRYEGYSMIMLSQFSQQYMDASAGTAMFILKNLGYVKNLSTRPSQMRLLVEIIKTKNLMKKYTQEDLLNLPLMTDENRRRGINIVYRIIGATFSNNPNLFLVLVLMATRWTVKYGVSKYSPPMISVYGLIVCGLLEDFDHGGMIGEVALALSERLHAVQTVAMTTSTVFSFIKHWKNDMRIARKPLQYGYQMGLQMGDNVNAIVDLICIEMTSLLTGYQDLDSLESSIRGSIAKIRSLGHEYYAVEHCCAWQFVLNLLGKYDKSRLILTGEAMNQEEALVDAKERNHKMVNAMVFYYSGMLGYYYEDYEHAVSNLKQISKTACLGYITMPRHVCLQALAHVALALEGKGPRQNLREAKKMMKMLKKWIDAGNPNIPHLVCLLEAEMAALQSPNKAEALYQTAIRVVARSGYRHDKAIAHARAARFFFVVRKDDHWGSYHIDKSIEAYADWGANGVVNHLVEKYVMPDEEIIFSQGFALSDVTTNVVKEMSTFFN